MSVQRYPENCPVTSQQDPFIDIMNWLSFVCAKDYLEEILTTRHHIKEKDAKIRSAKIIPHVRIATSYLQQSLDGPSDISFLPAYYAILNLMKIYILLGPRHSDLPYHRWHGVTYDVHRKDSQSILTEIVTLKQHGVFPLFYETVTGKCLPSINVNLYMRDILPYINGVTHEYKLATGLDAFLSALSLDYVKGGQQLRPEITVLEPDYDIKKRQLKALRSFAKRRSKNNVFIGKRIVDGSDLNVQTRKQLNTHLIYRRSPHYTLVPISSMRIEFPEELPISLTFFYMSSIVRYKPEFFDKLKDSRFWPLLSSTRVHGFYSFLMAFWSFIHQKNYYLNEA